MVMVTVQLGEGYIDELDRRMERAKISHRQLAHEMGKSSSQISRWFTKNKARRVSPSLEMAKQLEETFAKLKARRDRL